MAGSFRGQYQHKISDTGRISVPAKFREILKVKYGSDELALLSMRDHLRLYPTVEWDKEEARLEADSDGDSEFRNFLRRLYADMDEPVIDNNGRLMISADIRQKNGIQGDCIINGFKNHFEIWPVDVWNAKVTDGKDSDLFAKFADRIR